MGRRGGRGKGGKVEGGKVRRGEGGVKKKIGRQAPRLAKTERVDLIVARMTSDDENVQWLQWLQSSNAGLRPLRGCTDLEMLLRRLFSSKVEVGERARMVYPSVRNAAAAQGWSLEAVLASISGSGTGGVVTKGDVLAFAESGQTPGGGGGEGAAGGGGATGATGFAYVFSEGGVESRFRVVDTPGKMLPKEERHADVSVSPAQSAHASAVMAAKAAIPAVYASADVPVGGLAERLNIDLAEAISTGSSATGVGVPPKMARFLMVSASQALRTHSALNGHWDDGAGMFVPAPSVVFSVTHVGPDGNPTTTTVPKAEALPLNALGAVLEHPGDDNNASVAPTFNVVSLSPLVTDGALFSVAPPAVATLSIGALSSVMVPKTHPETGALTLAVDNHVSLSLTADARAADTEDLAAFLDTLVTSVSNPIALLK